MKKPINTEPQEDKSTLIPIPIEDEVRQAFIDYSMSVITSRAVPDARDGLKPVHRRIIFDMNEQHLYASGKTYKCATIVGDVLGKYHPHGDASVYDALVRLGQDFSQRYIVVEPGGNFGTIAGDPPAAYRYTEAKMTKLAEEMVADIGKETVDMMPNFDDTRKEPTVLPTKFPFLLCNGSMGIAVGMATNMPPHNLREVGSAICAYIDNPNIEIDELCTHIKGPDFPTGGIIFGRKGIKEAYKTGRGKILVRGRFTIEVSKTGLESIVFTEVPYGINTKTLCERIGELARNKEIDGISGINDESSDRTGMRIVIHLKRGAMTKLVINQLFSKTALQSSFGVINLALVKGRPQVLNLKQLIKCFVDHRDDVITRRTQYDLKVAEHELHILEALIIAVNNIDEVVKIIKESRDTDHARNNLMTRFALDEEQAQAILDMPLKRLTHLQIEDLQKKVAELQALIAYLKDLLEHHEKILNIIKTETNDLVDKYGDDRRTDIVSGEVESINVEDMIKREKMVVLISNLGYIKRVPITTYKAQGRGGKGSAGTKLVEDDFINEIFIATTHASVTFITSEGRAYWVKIHEIPESAKNARGSHIKSLLSLSPNEEITAVVTMEEFKENYYILMATAGGVVKKVACSEFANAKTRGVLAIRLKDGDKLVSAILTEGKDDVVLITRRGRALRFNEDKVRPMGRASGGNRGIKLGINDELTAALRIEENSKMILITEFGYGKRVEFDQFGPHGRGTGGQKVYNITEKSGEIVGAITIADKDDLVCITSQGKTLRLKSKKIPIRSRTAGGIHMFTIDSPDMVIGLDRIVHDEEEKDTPALEDDVPETFEEDEGASINEADDTVDDEPAEE